MKSKFHSTRKRDPQREPITPENLTEKTSFLRAFVDWLSLWEEATSGSKSGLSKETFGCAKQSSAALAALSEQLITHDNFDYFLSGKAQSDKIERRFGKSRQMSGGNLYASVRQFLESDRTLRIKNLAKLNLSLSEIRELFLDSNQEQLEKIEDVAEQIFQGLDSENTIEVSPNLPEAEKNIFFYVSGRFARSLCQNTKCSFCKELLVSKNSDKSFSVVSDSEDTNYPGSSDFLNQVNRGGLTVPSELSFLTCVQAREFYKKIMSDSKLKDLLHSPNVSAQKVFQSAFLTFLDCSEETRFLFLIQTCQNDHAFRNITEKFAGKIFNLFSKNFSSVVNSEIHSKRHRKNDKTKRDPTVFKVAKLQSDSL